MKGFSKNWKETGAQALFLIAACTSVLAVILICAFLFANGLPAIGKIGPLNFLMGQTWRPGNNIFGILPFIMGSIYVTAGAIAIGVPIGILTSVYMAKFCPKKIYKPLKAATELLAGIPSVVYGFFGIMVLVPLIRQLPHCKGNVMLTACILLGIMILPTIIGVTESAIRSVPESYYEGALALGATHERSIFTVVLPAAKSGILAGVVLGIGRAIGETMAVIMVAGNQPRMPQGLLKGVRTMTTNIVMEMGYAADLHREALIATAVVLFIFILIINVSVSLLNRRVNMEAINRQTAADKFRSYLKHPGSLILFLLVSLAAFATFLVLIFLIAYILIRGIPYLNLDLFSFTYNSDNASLFPALVNTVIMVVLSLILAVPIGIFSAIFLVEYAQRGSKIVKIIRLTAETLSGIPSIVYGLFGFLFFVTTLRWSYSMLAGAFTLAIMILPLIMRTTEEALKSVPDSYREGSFGLGAGKLRTVFSIVLPSAIPGILAGVILAVGRIVGETAALMYTSGTVAKIPGLMGSGRTLAVHMYVLSSEGLHTNQASATAVVLLVIVVGINALSNFVAKRLGKKAAGV